MDDTFTNTIKPNFLSFQNDKDIFLSEYIMFYIVIAMLLWSSLGILIKSSKLDTLSLIFFPACISAIILLVTILTRDYRALQMNLSQIALIYILSIVGLLNTLTFFYAYKYTTITLAVLTHYTAPFFVVILSSIFLNEKITKKTILSILSATIGMITILDISFDELFTQLIMRDKNLLGILSGLVSGLFYAIGIILYKKALFKTEVLPLMFFQSSFVVLNLLPFMKITNNLKDSILTLFFIGIFLSTIAPIFYLKGIKKVRATTAAILGYIEPLSAILLGVVFLKENLTLNIFFGGLLIIISGLFCSIEDNKHGLSIQKRTLQDSKEF